LAARRSIHPRPSRTCNSAQPRALDVERLTDRGLRSARIGLDQQHHRILRRAHVHWRQRADEILKTAICRRRRK
jgi:hypothetical protein